jgi:hypothetical protein
LGFFHEIFLSSQVKLIMIGNNLLSFLVLRISARGWLGTGAGARIRAAGSLVRRIWAGIGRGGADSVGIFVSFEWQQHFQMQAPVAKIIAIAIIVAGKAQCASGFIM